MNLKEQIRRILKEEVKLSSSFKRRISKFKEIIKHSYAMQNPCDFEDFTQFMMGINLEIEAYASGDYDSDYIENESGWLTYKEGSDFVETYMIDELKDYYYQMCKNDD
jgi:hypothetical protein